MNNFNNIESENHVVNQPTDQTTSQPKINRGWNDPVQDEMDSGLEEQGFYVEDQSNNNKNAFLLLGICVLGTIAVYLFGIHQQPKQASAQDKALEAKIDMALAKLVNSKQQVKAKQLFSDTGKLVKAFYQYPGQQQVALEDLEKNPFSRLDEIATEKKIDRAKLEAEIKSKLEAKLGSLSLQTIIKTQNGAKCMINGKIFSTGQLVDNTFLVTSISDSTVKLSARSFIFILKVDDR